MKLKFSRAEWLAIYGDWAKRAVTVSSGPAYLTLLSSERCNLSCFMCSHDLIKEIPVSIDAATTGAFLAKAHRLFLAGGEPLWMTDTVNRAAKDIFESILKNYPQLKINAYTNGLLLDERMAEAVLDRFESIHFSVDSLEPDVYARIRGKPMLDTLLKNMERLAEKKRRRGLKPADFPHINMNTIVMKSTVEGLPDVAQKLAQLGGYKHFLVKLRDTIGYDHQGVARHTLAENRLADTPQNKDAAIRRIAANHSRILEEIFLPGMMEPGKYSLIIEKLKGIYAASGIKVEDQGNFLGGAAAKSRPPGMAAVCPAPWVTADIGEGGSVTCCCAHLEVLGNVRTQSLDEIWNGKRIKTIREAFIRGEMKGCIQSGCPAGYDYFIVGENSYSFALLQNLARAFGAAEHPPSILLLKTAPDYQTHLAARTLLRAFPDSRLTIVVGKTGEAACRAWNIKNANVAVYPETMFQPKAFLSWWKPEKGSYALAAAPYNNEDRTGYEGVEEIIMATGARWKIGITPGGEVVTL